MLFIIPELYKELSYARDAKPPGGFLEIHFGAYRCRGRRYAKYLGASARRSLSAELGRYCSKIQELLRYCHDRKIPVVYLHTTKRKDLAEVGIFAISNRRPMMPIINGAISRARQARKSTSR
jgi:hypothetical protein